MRAPPKQGRIVRPLRGGSVTASSEYGTPETQVFGSFTDYVKPTPKPPIDFSKLEKGKLVPIDELEKAIGYKRNEPEYRVKLLAIRDAARDARPELWPHIRTDHDAIRVMLDSEAVEYNQKLIKEAEKRIVRIVGGLTAVDVNQLTADQRRAKDLYDQHNAMRVMNIVSLRKKQARSFGALVAKKLPAKETEPEEDET
jgi:hypothetical protein